MDLESNVRYVPHVGPTMAGRLDRLEIRTIRDLLFHLPFRYDDFSVVSKIESVRTGETVTIHGRVVEVKNEFTKRGKRLQRGIIGDESGRIDVVWFNQTYLPKILTPGMEVSLSGKVEFFGAKKALISPQFEVIKNGLTATHTGRLVPIYPETAGVSSKWLRSRIKDLLESMAQLDETLPGEFLKRHDLVPLHQALDDVHFPPDIQSAERARKRLAFEELLTIQLAAQQRKRYWKDRRKAHAISVKQGEVESFIEKLPFKLTGAQERASKEILDDISRTLPMNRLLEGDTGSGKTVVAAIGAYVSFLNGLKTVFMAPTEILANQHSQTLERLLGPFGIKVDLVTGSNKGRGEPWDVLVGTQALLYGKAMEKVGLLVIDEQHRFGVSQRTQLTKGKLVPHLLTMTATPIPRTVALTFYGDLDLSLVDELPEGRRKVITYVVPPEKRTASFRWLRERVEDTGEKAFIVYPLIEESETLVDVRAATKEFQTLKDEFFGGVKVGLVHGRMKPAEKNEVLDDFAKGETKILVATPVVEVGIDVSEATIMIVEGAERFGLAQLHQLRGRVGRSDKESQCFLLTESDNPFVLRRLASLAKVHSGAELAEIDLKMRGPGEVYGLRQHGFPALKAANINDLELVAQTRAASFELVDKLEDLPALRKNLESYKMAEVSPN